MHWGEQVVYDSSAALVAHIRGRRRQLLARSPAYLAVCATANGAQQPQLLALDDLAGAPGDLSASAQPPLALPPSALLRLLLRQPHVARLARLHVRHRGALRRAWRPAPLTDRHGRARHWGVEGLGSGRRAARPCLADLPTASSSSCCSCCKGTARRLPLHGTHAAAKLPCARAANSHSCRRCCCQRSLRAIRGQGRAEAAHAAAVVQLAEGI